MKYRVTIDGQERTVEVQLRDDGTTADVIVDGVAETVCFERMPEGILLRIGHRVVDAVIAGPVDARSIASGAVRTVVAIESERQRARRHRDGARATGGGELRSPMPGRIVKVLTSVGAVVRAGEPLVIVEAMKMQNELSLEVGGAVAEIHVGEGQSVESNTLLLRL